MRDCVAIPRRIIYQRTAHAGTALYPTIALVAEVESDMSTSDCARYCHAKLYMANGPALSAPRHVRNRLSLDLEVWESGSTMTMQLRSQESLKSRRGRYIAIVRIIVQDRV